MNTRDYLEGLSFDGYKFFGAHKKDKGYIFRLLAKEASEVYIIGDFNNWQRQAMRKYPTGVFSISIEDAKAGQKYQYIIKNSDKEFKKIDPYSKMIDYKEKSSVLVDDDYKFKSKRKKATNRNILQLHLATLFKNKDKTSDEIFDSIIEHCLANNYTSVLLMPVNEYQNYKSMGYSAMNLFSYSERYASGLDFKKFIDKAHKNNIELFLEVDIGGFDPDENGLLRFDGSNMYNYDYEDIVYNYYGSINYDLSKNFTKSYIQSAIGYWVNEYRLDGILLPSVENSLYWQGDKTRGINKNNIAFIENLISYLKAKDILSLASYNGTYDLDLSFDMVFDNRSKTLINMLKDQAIKRDYYKNFINDIIVNDRKDRVLGFSYVDSYQNEANLAMKMHTDDKKFEQEKVLFTFLYSLKSPKLLFMGDDCGDLRTYSIYNKFTFDSYENNLKDINKYYRDISKVFKKEKALNSKDSLTQYLDIGGFSLYAYKRIYKDEQLLVIINFTDIDYEIRSDYSLEEIINTESLEYKGSANVNGLVNIGEMINIKGFSAAIFKIK